ncbi:unnamed protein product [Pleuronectes platessa]|uniref:Uncharacterized protein n=1 Tax=Pleuronectes platessa TaxID=8262 RepID=A0A9N7ZAE5_PLEPL|nr:unnamed protein product [Pleuronectes platessa]
MNPFLSLCGLVLPRYRLSLCSGSVFAVRATLGRHYIPTHFDGKKLKKQLKAVAGACEINPEETKEEGDEMRVEAAALCQRCFHREQLEQGGRAHMHAHTRLMPGKEEEEVEEEEEEA